MQKTRLLAFVLLVPLLTWVALCHYRYDENFLCETCAACRTESRWFIGVTPLGYPLIRDFGSPHGPGAIPLTPSTVQIRPSPATTNLCPSDHVHQWRFAGANPLYLLGTRWGGCVLGGASRPSSPFAFVYLRDERFVSFIEAQVRGGRFTRKCVWGLFQGKQHDARLETDRILNEYWRTHPNKDVQWMYHLIFSEPPTSDVSSSLTASR